MLVAEVRLVLGIQTTDLYIRFFLNCLFLGYWFCAH